LTKRTEEEIQNICNDYKSGLSLDNLIKKYKISGKTLNKLLSSKNIIKRTPSEINRVSSRKYPINEHALDDMHLVKNMWFLGWFLSDGCLKTYRNSYTLSFGLHQKDKVVLHHISNIFYTDKENHVHLNTVKNVKRKKEYLQANLNINSYLLGKKLKEIGIHERKSLNSEYPKIIKDLPIDQQYAFIWGIYEGDGGLYFSKRQHKTKQDYLRAQIKICGTKDVCDNIAYIIKNHLNINSPVYNQLNICILNINNNKQVRKFLDWIYQDVNSGAADYFLPRKYERYLDLCKYIDEGIMPEKLTYDK